MFAPRYTVNVGGLIIEMGPPHKQEDVEVFAELLSSPKVTRYLEVRYGFTAEDEADWYYKVRTDADSRTWLLYDVTDGERLLLGTTSIVLRSAPLKTAVSGCLIARPEYWGKGVAKATHAVRTWYAFRQEGVICLRSAVFEPNTGSLKALESVGYVVVGRERDDGKLAAKLNLECVNPDRMAWQAWWSGSPAPKRFRNARQKTVAALKTAEDAALLS